jgi:small-conductance mechanosensitive channel
MNLIEDQSNRKAQLSARVQHAAGKWFIFVLSVFVFPFVCLSQSESAAPRSQQDVIDFLNKTVDWYQRGQAQERVGTAPVDNFFLNSNRPVADQIVHLSFDFARARATMAENGLAAAAAKSGTEAHYNRLSQESVQLDARAKQLQSELESLQKKKLTPSHSQGKNVDSAIARVQSQLVLLQTRQSTVRSIMEFIGGSSEPDSLTGQIDDLERAIPKSPESQTTTAKSGNAPSTTNAVKTDSGMWSVIGQLIDTSKKLKSIKSAIRQTNQLNQSVKQMQAPLRNEIQDLVQKSDTDMRQPDTLDPAVLAGQKSALDASNNRFKLLAAALLPLSKQQILLGSYQKTLQDWDAAVGIEYASQWRGLIVRLAILGIILGIVLGIFALWRRVIVRYIPDLSRRYQFMLMRKIALGVVMGLILLVAFASQLGSLATFAGLLTAGLAVALQNLFLAVAGYFILIGKFGVRAGDRVQIADVKGQVVEIGVLRLQLLELSEMDADAQPTGRIVAFSNSVVFQPLAGFFKHLPGTSLVWQDVNLTVANECDYQIVEQRTFAAVSAAFRQYRDDLEHLRTRMERNLESISIGSLEPRVRFRITHAGIEINIRFPAELRKAGEYNDRITTELLRAVELEPKLKIIQAESPALQKHIFTTNVDEPAHA